MQQNPGPRLRLFGPDAKYGAKPRKGFVRYVWYIVWREDGQRRERATSCDHNAQPQELEEELSAFLAKQQLSRELVRAVGPCGPDAIKVTDMLSAYAIGHAQHTHAPERAGYAIDVLASWWGETMVSGVTRATCQRYARERKAMIASSSVVRSTLRVRPRAQGDDPSQAPRRDGIGRDSAARIRHARSRVELVPP